MNHPKSNRVRRGSWQMVAGLLAIWNASNGPAAAHDLAAVRLVPNRAGGGAMLAWVEADAKPARGGATPAGAAHPAQALPFEQFAPRVKVHWDDGYLYVEGNGMPAHGMMVGITAWQQQVPLPQSYVGDNAWRIPLHPVPSTEPVSIRGRFLRGAVALAANGIPIFNPQNNRGEVSQEIGELDQWGGHCGRADDYHYHTAPLHLQEVVGKGQPIAYALDGYPIYGLLEPDGTPVGKLDAFNGHETPGVGYHYHGSTKYPYVNGGFHGVVVEREGQVDPQPRAEPVRESLTPLRGARITGFTVTNDRVYELQFEVGGEKRRVEYEVKDDRTVVFQFTDGSGGSRTETYSARERRAGRGRPPGDSRPPGRRRGGGGDTEERRPRGDRQGGRSADAGPSDSGTITVAALAPVAGRAGHLVLHSPAVKAGGPLPVEFTGDGESATPPLDWTGVPEGTRAFAVIMHHIDPEGRAKWYWTLYNIPADVRSLPKDVKGVGTLGNNGVNRRLGYAPPHSKGPGAKKYTFTLYALSAPVSVTVPPGDVNRDVLLAAMKESILDSAELDVVYDRTGLVAGQGEESGRLRGRKGERQDP